MATNGAVIAAEEPVWLDSLEVVEASSDQKQIVVPTALTHYDGEFLRGLGIADFTELAPMTPGFFASNQSVDNVSLNIRGLTSDSSDPRAQPRVSVFQDGVALQNVHGNSVAFFDLAEVTVFKGPQATRFGEGVESGALALTSRRADESTSGALTLGAGDYQARSAEGVVNAPIVAEKLFARVAVFANEREGYVKNLADGSDLQGEDTVAARASLRWRPTVATTGDLIFNIQRDDTPGVAFKSGVIPVSPTSSDTDPFTDANLTRGSELGVERTILGLTGIVRHEFNDAWALNSTSAWRDVEGINEFDADGSYLYLLELGEDFSGKQLSEELRLDFDSGDRFTGSLGMNFAWSEDSQTTTIRTDENVLWSFITGTPPPIPLNNRYAEHNRNIAETTSGDVFGRLDYKFTDKLTVGGGLRLTQERLVSTYQSFAADPAGTLPVPLLPTSGAGNNIFRATNGALENSAEEQSWAGEAGATYALTPKLAGFVTASRGRRPPILDFNGVTLAPRHGAEEQVWNYEAGMRGASAGRRVRYDASVFQYYFDHFQTERVTGLGVRESFDGGRARGQGLATSAQVDVARELTLFANYGFTDAKFSSQSEDGDLQAYAGNSFRLTSRHVLSVGGTVSLPGPKSGTVFFTPLYSYRSEYFFADDNAQNGGALHQSGFGLLDLRLGFRSRSSRWEVVTYVDNVLGEEYLLDAGNIGGSYGLPTFVSAAPRTCGMKATVRF